TGPMPLTPARMFFHAVETSLPTGLMMPMPVTTTRRLLMLFGSTVLRESASDTTCERTPKTQAAPRRRSRGNSNEEKSGFDVRLDVVDRLLHGRDLLGFLVRDLALEFFLERHHQLDGIQRVGAQIVHERRVRRDFVFFDAQLFDYDLLDAFFDGAH